MKKVCMLLACMGMVLSLHAVPAKRGVTKTVTNADGTTLTISLRGDETFHYYVDEKGNRIFIDTGRNGDTFGFDTEKNGYEEIKINGMNAIAATNSDCLILVWSTGKYTNMITADVT